jgi:hypothetical protein
MLKPEQVDKLWPTAPALTRSDSGRCFAVYRNVDRGRKRFAIERWIHVPVLDSPTTRANVISGDKARALQVPTYPQRPLKRHRSFAPSQIDNANFEASCVVRSLCGEVTSTDAPSLMRRWAYALRPSPPSLMRLRLRVRLSQISGIFST